MDSYRPERKRRRARERIAERQRRRETLFAPRPVNAIPRGSQSAQQVWNARIERWQLVLAEVWWRATHTPQVLAALGGLALLVFTIFVLVNVVSGRVFPNVWALGIDLGGLTVDEAVERLETAWQRSVRISLTDDDRSWSTTPAELGLAFDARATAEAARGVGLAGVPFGYAVPAQVTVSDELRAQNYLLDVSLQANVAPYNAGYRWQGDTLVTVPAREGKLTDVAATLGVLLRDPQRVVEERRLTLVMSPVVPDLSDPEQYLQVAQALASQTFEMNGYDPFLDETITWSTDRDTFTSWLEVDGGGLDLREDAFRPFLDSQARALAATGDGLRFIEPNDATEKLRNAIRQGTPTITVRVRYRSTTYTVARGDTGWGISRKTGIPFFLIQQANPNLNWETTILSPGDTIQLPPRDLVLPLDPVPHKRIIVNLDTQSLIAYENGEVVFNWAISSGISSSPTMPGVYQILSHDELATGSSYTLCGDRGCGQWRMYWFMGIYEVFPGLMNGFHGAVELPNGTYLGGGNVGQPYTFGCVMSRDEDARLLFEWADTGTVVEIVSRDFSPQSELARAALGRST